MTAPAIPLAGQIAGVEFARARLCEEAARGLAIGNAGVLAEIDRALGQLDAALVTLRWLARDRDGCIRLLTTRAGG